MPAEVLGSLVDNLIVQSSDIDFTPFDKGAYTRNTIYISGEAVRKVAVQIRDQVRPHPADMLGV